MIQCNCVRLPDQWTEDCEWLYATASQARRERADQCRRREDGLRILAAEALLRYTLRSQFGTSDFTVKLGAAGKPELVNKPEFCFNLSHSGMWVALAYDTRPVGVDVERINPAANLGALSKRLFTAEEQQYIASEDQAKTERFFRIWTAKESYLKFLGTGLTRPLNSFCVLNPEIGVHFRHQVLEGEAVLCICGEREIAEPNETDLDLIRKMEQTR